MLIREKPRTTELKPTLDAYDIAFPGYKETFDKRRYFEKKRVVVTGMGAVSPNGIGIPEFWKNLKAGVNAVDRTSIFDPSDLPSQVSGEVKEFEKIRRILPKKLVNAVPRIVPLTLVAAEEALNDAGILSNQELLENLDLVMGTGAHGLAYFEQQVKNYYEKGYKSVSPHTVTGTFIGMTASEIALHFGIKGLNTVLSDGCTASCNAIGTAYKMVQYGETKLVMSGAGESAISPAIIAGFCRVGALATNHNNEPKKASRPFDQKRNGFVMGEGAWTFVLEELEHAKQRNAKIYAEIVGFGSTNDAYHRTSPLPSGEQLANAMEQAIYDANIEKDQISYIHAHGTSTVLNDKCETIAIKRCFGETAKNIPIGSYKSMLGHPQGAAASCGLAGAIMAMQDDYIPPTINYEFPDPDCDLDYVPNIGRKHKVDHALINSVAFGAKNASLVVKSFKEQAGH